MIKIKEAIIVEGKYDINTLKQLIDTVIIETGGFRIFSDKARLEMIRKIAQKRGILVLTDSDGAGFVIRNYLKSSIPRSQVKHAYIPDIYGKEKRKSSHSKEKKLGVEGMKPEVLKNVLKLSGATFIDENESLNADLSAEKLEKKDLFALGLSGGVGSTQKRKMLLKKLDLPEHLSANAFLDFVNAVADKSEIEKIISEMEM